MPTDPLTGSRYPASTAVPNVAQDIQNAVVDLADNTIPRFTTTTARDTAYTSWVTLGGVMANGMRCDVNGVPYRRINGTWRIDRPRGFYRTLAITSPATGSIAAGGSNETGSTSGMNLVGGSGNTFTLYEASTVIVSASCRVGSATGAAVLTAKINGASIGNTSLSRLDMTISVTGSVALAAGVHNVSLRVDASGATVQWTDGALTIVETTAE